MAGKLKQNETKRNRFRIVYHDDDTVVVIVLRSIIQLNYRSIVWNDRLDYNRNKVIIS